MPEARNTPSAPDSPLPRASCLPIDYQQPPGPRPSRFGFIVFCLSIFALTFMATSYAMYRNVLGFNNRPIQLWIAWASITLGGLSAVLSPVALCLRPRAREIATLLIAALYWLIFYFLR